MKRMDPYADWPDDRFEQREEDRDRERMDRALWAADRDNYPPDLGDKTDDYR